MWRMDAERSEMSRLENKATQARLTSVQNENDLMSSEIRALKHALNMCRNDLSLKIEECSTLSSECAEAKKKLLTVDQIDSLREDKKRLKELEETSLVALARVTGELEKRNKQHEELKQSYKSVKEYVINLEDHYAKKKKTFEAIEAENNELKQRVYVGDKERYELRSRLVASDQKTRSMSEKITCFQEKIKTLTFEKEQLYKAKEDLVRQMNNNMPITGPIMMGSDSFLRPNVLSTPKHQVATVAADNDPSIQHTDSSMMNPTTIKTESNELLNVAAAADNKERDEFRSRLVASEQLLSSMNDKIKTLTFESNGSQRREY